MFFGTPSCTKTTLSIWNICLVLFNITTYHLGRFQFGIENITFLLDLAYELTHNQQKELPSFVGEVFVFLDVVRHKGKGKAIPLQSWTGLRVQGGLDSHISRQSSQEGGKFVSLTHRPPLLPTKGSWYSVSVEAESNPGP
jgi:hypothetical protein